MSQPPAAAVATVDVAALKRIPGRASVSACVIVRDEARLLPECLQSLSFCDELIVVDSGSRDATVSLAAAAGARVVEQPWLGFPAQRNVALDHASGQWIIEVDADERVSPALRAEIEEFLADPRPGIEMAAMPVRNLFLGRLLGRSAKYPQYSHRLFVRGAYRHDEARTVHEGLVAHGAVHPLQADLEHLLADSWREAIGDAWRYARLEARQMHGPRRLGAFVRGAILRPLGKFLYRLTIDEGWRDGWQGISRITIECAIDVVVWIRHLLGAGGEHGSSSGVSAGTHYASRRFHAGSVRIVGVAFGASDAAHAVEWLGQAGRAGADVALVARSDRCGVGRSRPQPHDCADQAHQATIRTRELQGRGLLDLIHGLDCEEQLRTIDAVVAFGWRARLLARLVPPKLRGALDSTAFPEGAAAVIQAGLALRTESGDR